MKQKHLELDATDVNSAAVQKIQYYLDGRFHAETDATTGTHALSMPDYKVPAVIMFKTSYF